MTRRRYVLRTFFCEHCNHTEHALQEREEERACTNCQEMMASKDIKKRTNKPFTPYHHIGMDQYFYTRDEEKSYAKKHGFVDITGCFGKKLADRDHTPQTKHTPMIDAIQQAKRGRR